MLRLKKFQELDYLGLRVRVTVSGLGRHVGRWAAQIESKACLHGVYSGYLV